MTIDKELSIASLLKLELKKARIKKSNNYKRVSSMKDKLEMSRISNSDGTSDLKEYLDTLEC